MNEREAIAAGSFYPGDKKALQGLLSDFFEGKSTRKKSCCIVAPHAGYAFSGKIAATAFNTLKKADSYVILSPNHTGLGKEISVSNADFWKTPLGKIEVDAELRSSLIKGLGIEADDLAHSGEHSCEVQIPFIQFLFPKSKILPVTIGTGKLAELKALGTELEKVAGSGNVGIVASGDFSHHTPLESAKEKDLSAVKLIEKMDFEGFYSKVVGENLSICGLSPITCAMVYCAKKGIKKGQLLEYATSGEVTGDFESVVGYAAINFE